MIIRYAKKYDEKKNKKILRDKKEINKYIFQIHEQMAKIDQYLCILDKQN